MPDFIKITLNLREKREKAEHSAEYLQSPIYIQLNQERNIILIRRYRQDDARHGKRLHLK